MTSNIKSISSPTHPIQFEFGDSPAKAAVSLANEEGAPLGKDFDLFVTLATPSKTCARVQHDEAGNPIAMVALYPEFKEDEQFVNEMIFLVDRSGSMR